MTKTKKKQTRTRKADKLPLDKPVAEQTTPTTVDPPLPPKSEWEAKFLCCGDGWMMYRLRHVETRRADVYVVRQAGPTSWSWTKVSATRRDVVVSLPYMVQLDTQLAPTECNCGAWFHAKIDESGQRPPCKHLRVTAKLASMGEI